jgi:COP9 signalosome complex subunit 2
MSDEEYEYDEDMDDNNDDDDEEEEDEEDQFEYTDDEEEQDDDKVRLENAYYNAKSLRDTSVTEAVEAFEQVISQSSSPDGGGGGDYSSSSPSDQAIWTFKALKQLCKLQLKAGNSPEFLKNYHRLLGSIKSVSPNAVEKGIGGMMERMSSLCQQHQPSTVPLGGGGDGSSSTGGSGTMMIADDPQGLALQVYGSTLGVFHPVHGSFPNERLWFRTNLKMGQLLYERNETGRLQVVLKDLQANHQRSLEAMGISAEGGGGQQGSSGGSSSSSGNSTLMAQQSLEIHALQMQLYSRQKDYKKLRETYQTAVGVVAGSLPHPRTIAVIQELGGKMYMAGKEYGSAEKSFFQAFKSYDEAGDVSRLRCLKYLVLASMLHASVINPFDSQEARPYRDDAEIVAMTNLVQAFHANDIATFESILKTKRTILRDDFIREHMEDLLRTIRRQVLKRVLEPYSRITLQAISSQFLNDIDVKEVESLLVGMILDELLPARIDKVSGILYNFQGHHHRRRSVRSAVAAAGESGSTDRRTATSTAAASSSSSPAAEKFRAVGSLVDLLSTVNRDASYTLAGPSTSSGRVGSARSGSSPSPPGLKMGAPGAMVMH